MKRLLALLSAAILAVMGAPLALAEESPPVEVSARACLLMERETGEVLYAREEHKQLEPASVTKVMTMLLTVEALDSGSIRLDDIVTASAHAESMGGSQVFLKEGEQMSVEDLLKSVAVASGNDAAVALAEHLAGSEPAFVERMNRRAAELGMKDTHFVNCNGLPAEGHVTSAWDIALMSRELLSHESIRPFVGIWTDAIRGGEFHLANTNKLIRFYQGATGLKTGSTDSAGFCISASAERDGMELIAVVLGSKTSAKRFEGAKSLLNYGFGAYTLVDAAPREPFPAVEVALGAQDAVNVEQKESCRLLVKREQADQVTTRIQLPERVEAPVQAGQALGELVISVGEEQRRTLPLNAVEDVPRLTLWQIFSRLCAAVTGA
jgi:D-alanyl-D-alanine carboxypeptidase (penicillin-binding protein 5/6)